MIRSLEGIRGIAALIVALYHLGVGAQVFSVIRNGYIFVDLFFVLSGFVMFAAYGNRLKNAHDLKLFVIRRFGRLFPLLVFTTIVFILVVNGIALAKNLALAYGLGGVLNTPEATAYLVPSLLEILTTLTMTHSLGVFDHLILNTPSWSISTEFYAYLVFAAVCLLWRPARRLPVFFLLVLAGYGISVWATVNVHDCLVKGGCLSLTYDFGFMRCVYGFFLGSLTWEATQRWRANLPALQVLSLAGVAVLLLWVDAHPALAFAFPLVFALMIWSLSKDSGFLAKILLWPFFQMLGQRSYSLYMMHMPLLLLFDNVSRRVDGVAANVMLVVVYVWALCVVSGWTYRRVEDPFRIRFNEWSKRATRNPEPVVEAELPTVASSMDKAL